MINTTSPYYGMGMDFNNPYSMDFATSYMGFGGMPGAGFPNCNFTQSNYSAMQSGFFNQGPFFKSQQEQNAYNNTQNSINANIRSLAEYAATNEQDAFRQTYDNLLGMVIQQVQRENPNSNYSEKELIQIAKDRINNEFFRATGGQKTLSQMIDEGGSNPFWQGIKTGLFFNLFGDKEDASSNKALVSNRKTSFGELAAKYCGRTLGGAATGAAIGAVIGSIVPGVGTALGAGVGAIAGAAVSVVTSVISIFT